MTSMFIGAAAGAAATVPMTLTMEALHARLAGEPPRPLPPREVTEGLTAKAGVDRELDEVEMQDLTLAAHFGYGALCGALFGPIAPRGAASAITSGAAFGVAVWMASYLGWLPAFGVRQHASVDPLARSGLMIAAHVVWGGVTGALLAGARPGRRPRRGAMVTARRQRARQGRASIQDPAPA